MRLKSIVIFFTLFLILQMTIIASFLVGQSKRKSLVIIKSQPSGAMVYVNGENSFVGVTPFKISSNFRGVYNILAIKKGYEKKEHTYLFSGNERGILRLKLIPKTSAKAGIRSLIFPGWGQYYSERKSTAILLSLLQVGTTIKMINSIGDYNKAVDEYENAASIYEKNKNLYAYREANWDVVAEKYNKADDRYYKKQMWVMVTCSLWIYNVLDAIFFFPAFEKEIFNKALPNLSTNIQNGTTKLTLSLSF